MDTNMDLPENLESLKRPALQKLCKKFGIKANGKNVALIAALKEKKGMKPSDETPVTEDVSDMTPLLKTRKRKRSNTHNVSPNPILPTPLPSSPLSTPTELPSNLLPPPSSPQRTPSNTIPPPSSPPCNAMPPPSSPPCNAMLPPSSLPCNAMPPPSSPPCNAMPPPSPPPCNAMLPSPPPCNAMPPPSSPPCNAMPPPSPPPCNAMPPPSSPSCNAMPPPSSPQGPPTKPSPEHPSTPSFPPLSPRVPSAKRKRSATYSVSPPSTRNEGSPVVTTHEHPLETEPERKRQKLSTPEMDLEAELSYQETVVRKENASPSDSDIHDKILSLLDKRVEERKLDPNYKPLHPSSIPPVPEIRSRFEKLHERQFKRMTSITDYQKMKAMRAETLSAKKPKLSEARRKTKIPLPSAKARVKTVTPFRTSRQSEGFKFGNSSTTKEGVSKPFVFSAAKPSCTNKSAPPNAKLYKPHTGRLPDFNFKIY